MQELRQRTEMPFPKKTVSEKFFHVKAKNATKLQILANLKFQDVFKIKTYFVFACFVFFYFPWI